MDLVNLTLHPVVLVEQDGAVLLDQAPDGRVARRAETRRDIGAVTLPGGATVPLREVAFGDVTDLPAPRAGVLYVVSRATAEAAAGRPDVVYPDERVKDDAGRIIGCRALAYAVPQPSLIAKPVYDVSGRRRTGPAVLSLLAEPPGEDTSPPSR